MAPMTRPPIKRPATAHPIKMGGPHSVFFLGGPGWCFSIWFTFKSLSQAGLILPVTMPMTIRTTSTTKTRMTHRIKAASTVNILKMSCLRCGISLSVPDWCIFIQRMITRANITMPITGSRMILITRLPPNCHVRSDPFSLIRLPNTTSLTDNPRSDLRTDLGIEILHKWLHKSKNTLV